MKEKKTPYAHNPQYCMIRPEQDQEADEDIVSTGQS